MSRESKPWTDRRSVRPNLPSCNFAWRKESSSCTVYFLSGFAMNVPTIGWGGGVARLMTLKTICLRRTYPKAPCLYMTWKVDGTIPMYWWFIMAYQTNPPLGGLRPPSTFQMVWFIFWDGHLDWQRKLPRFEVMKSYSNPRMWVVDDQKS